MSPPDQVRLRYPWQRRGAYCSLGAAAMSTILQAVLYRDEEQLSASWPSKDVARSFGAQRTRREPTSCSRTSEPQRGSSAPICTLYAATMREERQCRCGTCRRRGEARLGARARLEDWASLSASEGGDKGLTVDNQTQRSMCFISAFREAWHSRPLAPNFLSVHRNCGTAEARSPAAYTNGGSSVGRSMPPPPPAIAVRLA